MIRIIRFLRVLPRDILSDVVSKQLVRSSTSIIANYVEAKSASSRKDYINFFTYALKSANESKVWLALIRDTCKNDQKNVRYLLDELDEISKILAASIITLKSKK